MKIKDVIAYCLVISLGIILAMHFVLFWIFGGVFIYEDNKAVLLLETIMSVAILGFGIERLLSAPGWVSDRTLDPAFDGERAARTAADDVQARVPAQTNRAALRIGPAWTQEEGLSLQN